MTYVDIYELVLGNGDYGSFFAVEIIMLSTKRESLISHCKENKLVLKDKIMNGSSSYHIIKSRHKFAMK